MQNIQKIYHNRTYSRADTNGDNNTFEQLMLVSGLALKKNITPYISTYVLNNHGREGGNH